MKTEIWQYDEYNRYVTCGKCKMDTTWRGEEEGDVLECDHCEKTSIIGCEYEEEYLNKEEQ